MKIECCLSGVELFPGPQESRLLHSSQSKGEAGSTRDWPQLDCMRLLRNRPIFSSLWLIRCALTISRATDMRVAQAQISMNLRAEEYYSKTPSRPPLGPCHPMHHS